MNAPLPTLGSATAPKAHHPPGMLRGILVAEDFTGALSGGALEMAITLASQTDAPLTVLHVDDRQPMGPWHAAEADTVDEEEHRHARLKAVIRDAVAASRRQLGIQTGGDIEPLVLDGDPASQILLTAFDLGSSLIVMGERNDCREKWPHLGGTAERVVRHAPCAVLVMKQQQPGLQLPPVAPHFPKLPKAS